MTKPVDAEVGNQEMGLGNLRLGMAQINPTVGDLEGNKGIISDYIRQAKAQDVDLLTFPELSLSGYPPEDLLLKAGFLRDNRKVLREVMVLVKGITVVVGFADSDGKGTIYNAAAVIQQGKVVAVYHKIHLPNYGVFDEERYFQAGKEPLVFVLKGTTIGVTICEDIWHSRGPAAVEVQEGGAEVILNISASPYHVGKGKIREKLLSESSRDNLAVISYNNLIGGQDELIFDGTGMIFDPRGKKIAQGREFEEDLIVADLNIDRVRDIRSKCKNRPGRDLSPQQKMKIKRVELPLVKDGKRKRPLPKRKMERLSRMEEIYRALVLGVHDYVRKNGFKKVLIGLSGGIDSSLTAVIAVDALGKDNVAGLSMPSVYSSAETQSDTLKLARKLEVELTTVPIGGIFRAYLDALREGFGGRKTDVTEENLQARIRGNILMAISNKYGSLVLTTGNKSEMGVGYCTLYGDMAGGFAVLKDVPKTLVYRLARYRNRKEGRSLIPRSILVREPSAELRPNQRDEDSLPPYSLLDPILEAYVEEDKSSESIVARGFNREIVKKAVLMVDRNEYKRRQGPPGVKITPRAFGKDRRFPITNRYRDF